MAINFPNNPVVGDTHTVGTSVWRWNGYAWIRIPDPGAKGEKGDGGQKGEQGITGDKGSQGDKGEKGDVEAQGNKGEKGEDGDKGEPSTVPGDKGQKGETGQDGQDGDDGASIKGEPGDATKGDKGEVGFKGDKGELGAGDKGDKGEEGSGGGGLTSDANENTFGGTDAGANLDADTYRNTLLGYKAGEQINSGDDNTFVGHKAGDVVTSGYKNVGVGAEVLPNLTSGYRNVAVGWEAGRSMSSGYNNTAIGDMAGRTFVSASECIAIGYHAASNFGSGSRVIGIGAESVWLGGTDLIGIGKFTMARGGSQVGGIGIGYYAGRNNKGDHNIYLGYQSGYGRNSSPYSTGEYNIAFGYRSLYNVDTSFNNIAIGSSTANTLTTGSNNIIIGSGVDVPSASTSNQIIIGDSDITKFSIPGINVVLKDNGGTPTQGHVLTVDSNGEASFEASSGGGGGSSDKIEEGNTKAEVVDTGSNGHFLVETEGAERLRIDSSGHVGIGSESPDASLDIIGTSVVGHFMSTNNDYVLRIQGNNATDKVFFGTTNSNDFLLANGDGGAGTVERLRITSDGKVGVNATSPREKLDISGGKIILDQGYQFTWANGTTNRARIHGDSGSNFIIETGSSNDERLRIGSSGQIGLGGANYGTSGQVLTSNGSSSAPTWQTVSGGGGSTTINNNADNRIITGSNTANTLNGESNLTFDGSNLVFDTAGSLKIKQSDETSFNWSKGIQVGYDSGSMPILIFAYNNNGYISDRGNELRITSDSSPIRIRTLNYGGNPENGDEIATFTPGGAVDLYHNANKKFETTSDGVKITGGLQDKDGNLGTNGQILSSTGTELDWVDAIGDKGEPGSSVKGEPGSSVKGEPGSDGSDGNSVKGEKGEAGSSSQLPVGTIVAYGGNTAPTGWQICNGGTASSSALQTLLGQTNVPDLRDRFIIGAGSSYSRHSAAGSKDAVLVSHSHTINNHTHTFTTSSDGNHYHNFPGDDQLTNANNIQGWGNVSDANFNYDAVSNYNSSTGQLWRTTNPKSASGNNHAHSGTTGNPSDRNTDSHGTSATNANLPPYYALLYIIKT